MRAMRARRVAAPGELEVEGPRVNHLSNDQTRPAFERAAAEMQSRRRMPSPASGPRPIRLESKHEISTGEMGLDNPFCAAEIQGGVK